MSEEVDFSTPRRINKKALGRGLGSLLRESVTDAPATEITEKPTSEPTAPRAVDKDRIWSIAIEKLRPNKEQPRKTFEPEGIQELANSIKEKGMLLPVVARKISEHQFEIIAGERRWRAAQRAGLQVVPVIFRDAENQDALELALIENIQRKELLPIEEAEAYGTLAVRYGLTQQEIAQKVGKERSTISNLLRLLGLAPEVKLMMRENKLPLGQAKVILALEQPQSQILAAKKVVAGQLSVRATENLVAKLKEDSLQNGHPTSSDEHHLTGKVNKTELNALKGELQKILGTRVEVEFNGTTGKVSAYVYSAAELNQLIDKLRKSQR